MPHNYWVYMLANRAGLVYVGVTNDLKRRVYEHRHKAGTGYARRHSIARLIYFESTPNGQAAIAREKQIKGWIRAKKLALIEAHNPSWADLSAGWYDEGKE